MTDHVAIIGAELTESQAAMRVFLAAGGLVLLGLALLLFTISWWRGTRPEPPALGPLEVMGDRRWATAAESERRRLLEEFRPVGAEPSNLFVEPQPVDLSVLAREAPPSFDDLREPLEDPEALEIAAESAGDDPDRSIEVDMVPEVEVDGTVAMVAPVSEALPTPSLVDEADVHRGHDDFGDHDATVPMRSPDQQVSPHAGA